MKILHLSDTHCRHRQLTHLPEADILVHSGDLTEEGTEEELVDFITWFEALDYPYKIFIPGNHDLCLYHATLEGLSSHTYCLNHQSVEIEGIKIYGLPLFVPDQRNGSYIRQIAAIPADTTVLVSHQPPLGILDGTTTNDGSLELLNKVYEIQPRLHLFGHVHDNGGILRLDGITFSNGVNSNQLFSIP